MCEVSGISRGDAGVLASLGWNMSRLGTLQDAGQEAVQAVLEKCQEADEGFQASMEELVTVVRLSDEMATAPAGPLGLGEGQEGQGAGWVPKGK